MHGAQSLQASAQERKHAASQMRAGVTFAQHVLVPGPAAQERALQPQLAGQDMFRGQCAPDRSIPMRGGLSAGGFSTVLYHPQRKLCTSERVHATVNAFKALDPVKENGLWHILCDDESVLTASKSMAEYRRWKVWPWQIPPKSLDLNPVWANSGFTYKGDCVSWISETVWKRRLFSAGVKRVMQSVRAAGNMAHLP